MFIYCLWMLNRWLKVKCCWIFKGLSLPTECFILWLKSLLFTIIISNSEPSENNQYYECASVFTRWLTSLCGCVNNMWADISCKLLNTVDAADWYTSWHTGLFHILSTRWLQITQWRRAVLSNRCFLARWASQCCKWCGKAGKLDL